MKRLILSCLFIVSVTACGDSESGASETTTPRTESTAEPTTTQAPTTTAETTSSEAAETAETAAEFDREPVAEDLVGRWAHFDAVAYQDGDFKTLIVSYGFNDFADADGQIIDSAQFCFSDQITNQPITASLSDAATQAIKPPSTPLQVEIVDGALTIRRNATPTPVGIRLDADEPLPTDPNDPRVVDDDGDGKPGLTVSIDAGSGITGELYIARREIFAYDAQLTAPDLIEGSVEDNSEQLIIGASDPIFMANANWAQVTNPELNPIVLKRVDSSWDCDRLAAEADSLFPTVPSVDW